MSEKTQTKGTIDSLYSAPAEETRPEKNKKAKQEFLRTLKYILVAASAGIIQFGVSTFFIEVVHWTKSSNLYWLGYLIALVLSVIWNFTFNRKYTFQSVANVPVAMMWVCLYYAVFTPCSILWQDAWLALPGWGDKLEMVVMVVTLLINGVTEFLWQRLFVYRKTIDTNSIAKQHHEQTTAAVEAAAVLNEVDESVLASGCANLTAQAATEQPENNP